MVTGVTSVSAVFVEAAFEELAEDFEDEAELFDDAEEDAFKAADEVPLSAGDSP